jgi:transcriptional repressor of cell division inhibition gene dicB
MLDPEEQHAVRSCAMKRQDVIAHFGGTQSSAAKALGITKSAVHQWGEIIPEGMAYKIQVITAGMLRVDPSLYEKEQADPPEAA